MSWQAPSIDAHTDLRQTFAPEFWLPAMRIIAERHGVSADDLSLFPSGTDIVYSAGAAVIKFTAPCWRKSLQQELVWLRWLDGRLDLEVPRPLASGELDGWPYQITTRVAGQAVARVWKWLSHQERLRLACEIGAAMAGLHAIATPPGDHRWPAFLAARRAGVVANHRSRGAALHWLDQLDATLDAIDRPDRPLVCLHTELLDEHIFVEQRAGRWRVSGLVDFADARVGHPDYELAALAEFLFKGEPGLLGACLAAYGWSRRDCVPAQAPRLLSWALLHRFASLPRALAAAGKPTPETLVALAERLYNPAL